MTLKFDHIQARLQRPTTKAKDRRAHLLEQFLARINTRERAERGYPVIQPPRIGMMLAHLDTDELEAFYKSCDGYRGGFSRAFWGALKVK